MILVKKSVLIKENWIEGGGDRVSVHFAVTFLDNNNKGCRSNVNKHELVYGESSSNAEMPDVCLSFVLLFAIFIIILTQTLVLQQSKNVTAKCTETLLPPLSFQFSLVLIIFSHFWFIASFFSRNLGIFKSLFSFYKITRDK